MPCNISDNLVTPPEFTPQPVPGFGSANGQLTDIPNLGFINKFPENLQALFDNFNLRLPPGLFKPSINPSIDRVNIDPIMKLLNDFSGFISIYKFGLPSIGIILCMIEILCAIPNPIKLGGKMQKLFRVCIPDFLAMFPIIAIIIMIISLILLIVALIAYIISEVTRIVNQLIKNIVLLGKIFAKRDSQSALIILRKLGHLLCFMQNIFAVLGVLDVLIQVIKAILLLVFGIPPCDDSAQDDTGCCTVEVCPAFIKSAPYTRENTGNLLYLSQVGPDASAISGIPEVFKTLFASLGQVRRESWQFYDSTLVGTEMFFNITFPVDVNPLLGFIFFPQGKVYTKDTFPTKAPYVVDLRFLYDPTPFGGTGVPRYIRMKDCIIDRTPTLALLNWANFPAQPFNGALSLVGGSAFEDDEKTHILVEGVQGSLNTMLHKDITIASTPADDGVTISDISYTVRVNHYVLAGETLITIGCLPAVAADRQLANATFTGLNPDRLRAVPLPDPAAAKICVDSALARYRTNMTLATTADFQSEVIGCLNVMLDDSKAALNQFVNIGVSNTKSSFTVDPASQFTTKTIKVKALLKDQNSASLGAGLPPDVGAQLAANFKPEITFGSITPFSYDGSEAFTAEISSDVGGVGTIRVQYNNNYFQNISLPIDLTVQASVGIQQLDYTFITAPIATSTGSGTLDDTTKVRRDATDTANDTGAGESS